MVFIGRIVLMLGYFCLINLLMVRLKFPCLLLKLSVEALDRTCTDREALPDDLLALVNLSLIMKPFVTCF